MQDQEGFDFIVKTCYSTGEHQYAFTPEFGVAAYKALCGGYMTKTKIKQFCSQLRGKEETIRAAVSWWRGLTQSQKEASVKPFEKDTGSTTLSGLSVSQQKIIAAELALERFQGGKGNLPNSVGNYRSLRARSPKHIFELTTVSAGNG